ncbi:MAG: hypothetical protein QM767_27920 [Anaeromyxobacter sp.]
MAALEAQRRAARDAGERRTAVFWTTLGWLHQEQPARALQAFQANLAGSVQDAALHAANLFIVAEIQLHAGQVDAALATLGEVDAALARATAAPEGVREALRRNRLHLTAWAEAAGGDRAAAQRDAAAFRAQAEASGQRLERQRADLLDGVVALTAGDGARAVAALAPLDEGDPEVEALRARALEAAGDRAAAREAWRRAAEYRGVQFALSWAFVRAEAVRALDRLGAT